VDEARSNGRPPHRRALQLREPAGGHITAAAVDSAQERLFVTGLRDDRAKFWYNSDGRRAAPSLSSARSTMWPFLTAVGFASDWWFIFAFSGITSQRAGMIGSSAGSGRAAGSRCNHDIATQLRVRAIDVSGLPGYSI